MSDPARPGAIGEALAALFLESRGWRIRARNFRAGRLELDLVAERGSTLACVEVKWRRADARFGGALAAWRPAQRRRAALAAWAAAREFDPGHERSLRFDLVAIEERPRGLVLEHHAGVWTPDRAAW